MHTMIRRTTVALVAASLALGAGALPAAGDTTTSGAIGSQYRALGFERGYGYPVTDEFTAAGAPVVNDRGGLGPGGAYQEF